MKILVPSTPISALMAHKVFLWIRFYQNSRPTNPGRTMFVVSRTSFFGHLVYPGTTIDVVRTGLWGPRLERRGFKGEAALVRGLHQEVLYL